MQAPSEHYGAGLSLDAMAPHWAQQAKIHSSRVRTDAELRKSGPEQLAARVAANEPGALEELYDTTSRMVFGLALRIVGDRAAAEEVTLDVYLQVWRQAAKFDASRASFLSWLMLLARSRALDYLRSKPSKARKQEQELDPADDRRFGAEGTSFVEARQMRESVSAALDGLDAARREAIELAFYEGCSHSEIAERLSLPLGTVKTRIRTGLQQLRSSLEAYRGSL